MMDDGPGRTWTIYMHWETREREYDRAKGDGTQGHILEGHSSGIERAAVAHISETGSWISCSSQPRPGSRPRIFCLSSELIGLSRLTHCPLM
ncbi:hypothetical protein Mapa_009377 [Marchantia paleacea]|nr:hypothetical protein Mapa_009377 [Marchantia paleacea]